MDNDSNDLDAAFGWLFGMLTSVLLIVVVILICLVG